MRFFTVRCSVAGLTFVAHGLGPENARVRIIINDNGLKLWKKLNLRSF
jgi:hypothetical protein